MEAAAHTLSARGNNADIIFKGSWSQSTLSGRSLRTVYVGLPLFYFGESCPKTEVASQDALDTNIPATSIDFSGWVYGTTIRKKEARETEKLEERETGK